jgi:hypothetical protein
MADEKTAEETKTTEETKKEDPKPTAYPLWKKIGLVGLGAAAGAGGFYLWNKKTSEPATTDQI